MSPLRTLTLPALLLALLCACSGDEVDACAGTYELDVGASAKEVPGIGRMVSDVRLTLEDDLTFRGSGTYLGRKTVVEGTWDVEDGTVTFTALRRTRRDLEETIVASYDDGELTVVVDVRGSPKRVVFRKR